MRAAGGVAHGGSTIARWLRGIGARAAGEPSFSATSRPSVSKGGSRRRLRGAPCEDRGLPLRQRLERMGRGRPPRTRPRGGHRWLEALRDGVGAGYAARAAAAEGRSARAFHGGAGLFVVVRGVAARGGHTGGRLRCGDLLQRHRDVHGPVRTGELLLCPRRSRCRRRRSRLRREAENKTRGIEARVEALAAVSGQSGAGYRVKARTTAGSAGGHCPSRGTCRRGSCLR